MEGAPLSNVIDGKRISQEMLREMEQEVKRYSDVGRPGLAVVQVGGREDSNIYIKKETTSLHGYRYDEHHSQPRHRHK